MSAERNDNGVSGVSCWFAEGELVLSVGGDRVRFSGEGSDEVSRFFEQNQGQLLLAADALCGFYIENSFRMFEYQQELVRSALSGIVSTAEVVGITLDLSGFKQD